MSCPGLSPAWAQQHTLPLPPAAAGPGAGTAWSTRLRGHSSVPSPAQHLLRQGRVQAEIFHMKPGDRHGTDTSTWKTDGWRMDGRTDGGPRLRTGRRLTQAGRLETGSKEAGLRPCTHALTLGAPGPGGGARRRSPAQCVRKRHSACGGAAHPCNPPGRTGAGTKPETPAREDWAARLWPSEQAPVSRQASARRACPSPGLPGH